MMHPFNGANYSDVKANNISAILMALLRLRVASRVQLASEIGVSSATMTNLTGELTEQGVLSEAGKIHGAIGRPQKALCISPDARYSIGVHVDIDRINICLTDAFANILTHEVITGIDQLTWQVALGKVTDCIRQMLQAQEIPQDRLAGVGVAAHGLIDPETGVNVIAPNMSWRNVPLRATFEEKLELPTTVDNNVRAMALYEGLFGVAKQVHTLAFVYARIGIGAGLMVNGSLYHGASAGAGEIGHTTVILDGGQRCRCGNTGCLETVFSEPILLELAEQVVTDHPDGLLARSVADGETPTLDGMFAAARAGDEVVSTRLKERARYIGIALANLINIFNPEMIVLGGIFSNERETLLPTIRDTVGRRAFGSLGKHVAIQPTARGAFVGMEGAASLALDRFFYRATSQ